LTTNLKISTWRKPTFSSVFPQLCFEPTFDTIEAHFFSEIFPRDLEKFIFLFGVEIWQKRSYKVFVCLELAFAKCKPMKKVQKPVFLTGFLHIPD
jgi:hypothetical protein